MQGESENEFSRHSSRLSRLSSLATAPRAQPSAKTEILFPLH